MPSLATKVKRILINRSKPNADDVLPLSNLTSTSPNPQASFVTTDTTTPNPSLDKIIPIPTHITDTLPQELYEIFISHLQDDIASLRACSLVCSAWTRTSQKRLFLLLVRPYQLSSKPGFRFKDPVRCAVIHEKTNVLYYGTSRGVYSRSLVKPDEIPVMRLNFVDILQMNIIDRAAAQGGSVLVLRSGGYLYTIELQHLQVQVPPPHPDSKQRPPKPKHARESSYYSIGLLSGHITVAIVNGRDIHLFRLGHAGVSLTLLGVSSSSSLSEGCTGYTYATKTKTLSIGLHIHPTSEINVLIPPWRTHNLYTL
ncbi:hypothetical protein BDN72DRAFT_463871 [Pluteus cervinus]|uniref:Uncharacterized protein n=1 Tax=Pluteus cervinus TaxID=181527 RepID=A0ACD3AZW0_9AGAR|nr:hypothetical protein BDN72DRAFT_463871 [Pluteus cervinus]